MIGEPKYQYYGYNGGEDSEVNLRKDLLNAFEENLDSKKEFEGFIKSLKKGVFNGKHFIDRKNIIHSTPLFTISTKYLKIYINYLYPDLDIKQPIKKYVSDYLDILISENRLSVMQKENQIKKLKNKGKSKPSDRKTFYCYYTKDGKELRNFLVRLNLKHKDVQIENTNSNRKYLGDFCTFGTHSSIYVRSEDMVSIHIILHTGREIESALIFGFMTLIDNKGKAVSTHAIFQSFTGKFIKDREVEESIKKYLFRNKVLKMNSDFETIEELDQHLLKTANFNSIKGFYCAYIISRKRKKVIPFSIYIDEFGRVESHRKDTDGAIKISEGIVYFREKVLLTMDLDIDESGGEMSSEYRIVLDISRIMIKKFGFHAGVYSGISIEKRNPRAGRICFIKQPNTIKKLDDIPIEAFKISSNQYKELLISYPKFEIFFTGRGEQDHLIESLDIFPNPDA